MGVPGPTKHAYTLADSYSQPDTDFYADCADLPTATPNQPSGKACSTHQSAIKNASSRSDQYPSFTAHRDATAHAAATDLASPADCNPDRQTNPDPGAICVTRF